jgi:hypothetical protein
VVPAGVTVTDMRWLDLEYIAFNMREIDRREIYGNLPDDNPLHLAALLMNAVAKKGVAWIAKYEGLPAAWLAFFEQWPGNWQVSLGGTEHVPKVLLALKSKVADGFRFAREHGAHRVECRNIASHREAEALVRCLGAEKEGVLRKYGRDGSDYHQWSWTGHRLILASDAR